MLYDANAASFLLGALMKNPDLLQNPQYPLSKNDFTPIQFHRILFVSIVRLAEEGCRDITEVEIDNYLQGFPEQYSVASDNNHLEFISTVRELTTLENFANYYDIVRKFGLLRDLQERGYDIREWYDEVDEQASKGDLSQYTIQDILSKLDNDSTALRVKYDIHYTRNDIIVGSHTPELIEYFENRPAFGALLTSPYLSEIINGWSRSHLLLRSAASGTGKSRMAVADLCGVAVDEYYDEQIGDFLVNPNYQGNGFFIHTELDTETEMQPMFLACIANVPYKKITMGQLTHEEKMRVIKAGEILKRNGLRLIDMPDFTSAKLRRQMRECKENDGAQYGVFDYMMLNSPLSMEYRNSTGVQAREDMALRGLATDLKENCELFNIGLLTMSQTNGAEGSSEFPDESCIAGSKAMRNKVDAGVVVVPSKDRPKEMKAVENLLSRKGFGDNREPPPNRITYIYKARFGEYGDQHIKIFHRFDNSTMRNKDFLVTDAYNRPIDVAIPTLSGGENIEYNPRED